MKKAVIIGSVLLLVIASFILFTFVAAVGYTSSTLTSATHLDTDVLSQVNTQDAVYYLTDMKDENKRFYLNFSQNLTNGSILKIYAKNEKGAAVGIYTLADSTGSTPLGTFTVTSTTGDWYNTTLTLSTPTNAIWLGEGTGSGTDPKEYFDYIYASIIDNAPPNAITNLLNRSLGTNWAYWTWANPIDADFSQAIIYLNSINIVNTSNNYYNATGLNENTTYQIMIYTKDVYENINTTNVSNTVRTLITCIPNLVNFTSDWVNLSCLDDNTMNQTRTLIQYDINFCGEVTNQTYAEYQNTETCDYCTPSLTNTSWTAWNNISSCYLNNTIDQARNLTQYDANACGETVNLTYYEYQSAACEYCTPNLTNTTWSDWYNVSDCYLNNTIAQERNLTQYDNNFCGGANLTFTESRDDNCTYVAPPSSSSSSSSSSGSGGSSRKSQTSTPEPETTTETTEKTAIKTTLTTETEGQMEKVTNLFYIGLDVTVEEVTDEDELVAKISLVNFDHSKVVEVNVTYTLFSNSGEVLYQETITIPVEVQTEFLKSFNLSGYPEGEYTLQAELQYAGQIEEAKEERTFTVKTTEEKSGNLLTGAATSIKNIGKLLSSIKIKADSKFIIAVIFGVLLLIGGATGTYYLTHFSHNRIQQRKITNSQTFSRNNSRLILTSAPKLDKRISKVLRTKNVPCVYVSLNKSSKNIKKMLEHRKVNLDRCYFIDCVAENDAKENIIDGKVLFVHPDRLDLLNTAINSFIDNIKGKKMIMVDALNQLRDYNSQKQMIQFINKVTAYAAQKEVPVIAFGLKSEIGEELQERIFNLFDKVEKR